MVEDLRAVVARTFEREAKPCARRRGGNDIGKQRLPQIGEAIEAKGANSPHNGCITRSRQGRDRSRRTQQSRIFLLDQTARDTLLGGRQSAN